MAAYRLRSGRVVPAAPNTRSSDAITVKLAIEPDVTLISSHPTKQEKRFQVSSFVLGQLSPYFNTLLRSSFQEGLLVRQGQHPKIALEGDDPDAMEIIFKILHAKSNPDYADLKLETLRLVARHANKYHCNEALFSWIRIWLNDYRHTARNAHGHGQLLLAAYWFDDDEKLRDFTAKAMVDLSPEVGIWLEEEVTEILPQHVAEGLSVQTRGFLRSIHRLIGAGELELRKSENVVCQCSKPVGMFFTGANPVRCTRQLRISEYIKTMRNHKPWPICEAGRINSMSALERQIYISLRHHKSCPLGYVLKTLDHRVSKIQGMIRGIGLSPLPANTPTGADKAEEFVDNLMKGLDDPWNSTAGNN